MRGLRADLAATAEAARSSARAADFSTAPATRATPRRATATLKEAEMLLQAFRDDLRVELRRHAGRHPLTPVTLETVRTVLDQARISIRQFPGPAEPQVAAAYARRPGSRPVPLMWET